MIEIVISGPEVKNHFTQKIFQRSAPNLNGTVL